jgi:hypothetical protein
LNRFVPETYVTVEDAGGHAVGQLLFYPRLDKVDSYVDWRVAFAASAAPSSDFDAAALIVLDAWKRVVAYVEQAWQTHLLPNV